MFLRDFPMILMLLGIDYLSSQSLTIQQKYNVSHIANFTFSSSHIEKIKRNQGKLISIIIINFNNNN